MLEIAVLVVNKVAVVDMRAMEDLWILGVGAS